VDIVIASAAEGMFQNVTMLMDQAVQKVKAIEEADNFVRRHYLQTKATLISKGYSEKDADLRAGVRIFDEPPGTFNLNTSTIAAASGTWDSTKGMTDDYISKLGHGYGNGFRGEPMADVFKLALSGTEKVVHSSSTMLYGALDNDDMFMYVGGLAAAIKSVDGKSPELVVANTRDPGRPEMTSMDKFIGTEFRSRYVNPTWIEGMKKEGYAGAGAMREFVEYLWGWNATVPELVDGAMWQETFETYVQDKRELGMQAFFEKSSPYAYQDITGRMAETMRKGYWSPDAATKSKIITAYIESVNAHGTSGAEFTTGNPQLTQFVVEQGRAAGVPVPTLQAFEATMARATGVDAARAADAARQFITRNEAARPDQAQADAAKATQAVPTPVAPPPAPPASAAQPSVGARPLTGFLMEQENRTPQPPPRPASPAPVDEQRAALMVAIPVLAVLLVWRYRRRSA
jgi:cobaltochelatase CobN